MITNYFVHIATHLHINQKKIWYLNTIIELQNTVGKNDHIMTNCSQK